jgi:hypothetical protein
MGGKFVAQAAKGGAWFYLCQLLLQSGDFLLKAMEAILLLHHQAVEGVEQVVVVAETNF